jgi:hypothetical protein
MFTLVFDIFIMCFILSEILSFTFLIPSSNFRVYSTSQSLFLLTCYSFVILCTLMCCPLLYVYVVVLRFCHWRMRRGIVVACFLRRRHRCCCWDGGGGPPPPTARVAAVLPLLLLGRWRRRRHPPGVVISFTNYSYCFCFCYIFVLSFH